jgi:hypothetical protein
MMKNWRTLLLLALCFPLSGETLYNGIELPKQWPPVIKKITNEPVPVPYLENPPEVISIDVGRQLFVDDFLIEETDLKRRFHQPHYHPDNPIFRPETKWEVGGGKSFAIPYSGGVWYDPSDEMLKMWYKAEDWQTCLALSEDGIHWKRPLLRKETGDNITLETVRDTSTIWLDHEDPDPARRFKLFEARNVGTYRLGFRVSANGYQWSDEIATSGPSWDRSTVFYNPFRKVWVASVRGHDHIPRDPVHRLRCYHEGKTPEEALAWKQHTDLVAKGEFLPNDLLPWMGADSLDPRHPDERFHHIPPQLYNLDAFPYESLLVGLFTIWQGPNNPTCKELGIHKRNEVLVGFSRDGFHWDRTHRDRFLPVSQNIQDWNGANVQSIGGGCVVMGDNLYFYCSGRTMHPRKTAATGLAILRRDGFASMNADASGGTLTTRPVRFHGSHLFVNVDASEGELSAELIDAKGEVIQPFTRENCVPVCKDNVTQVVAWKKGNLAQLSGKPVRFRFYLRHGSLYAFWLSKDSSGTSNGYVAAGGPGFAGAKDI